MDSCSGVQHSKDGKATFGHVYNQADPRQYFHTLRELDYNTPAHATAVFSALIEYAQASRSNGDGMTDDNGMTVLDVCSSYGVNAALLNHDVTLDSLYARYTSAEVAELSSSELASADIAFYRERRLPSAVPMIGLDVAEHAVAYGEHVGILTAGISENLEDAEPSDVLVRHLADVGLITVTGGIGYISERTFARILSRCSLEDPPSVAAFALRWVDYRSIAATLQSYGLVTEKLTGTTFPQRRFIDETEQAYVLDQLAEMEIDPTGKEADGSYHAELYVSRPQGQVAADPLAELLAGTV